MNSLVIIGCVDNATASPAIAACHSLLTTLPALADAVKSQTA